jgi:hypothetical protein
VSSSGSGEARPQRTQRSAPAEQHLGDRLAAFVDGELTDDSRDRVLAHLATCPQCKTAAAEQRRMKSVIAQSELPAISAGLLARLQGLPGMGADTGLPGGSGGPTLPSGSGGPALPGGGPLRPAEADDDRAARHGPLDGGLLGSGPGLFGGSRRDDYSYLGPGRDLTAPAGSRSRGFRVHQAIRAITPVSPLAPAAGRGRPVGAGVDTRGAHGATAVGASGTPGGSGAGSAPASRGRRFAFAAAGAFSMAAIAIGGALPMEAAVDGGAHPDDGPAVSPLGASTSTVSDTRGVTPRGMLDAEERAGRRTPAAAVPSTWPDAPRPQPYQAAVRSSPSSPYALSASSVVLH